MENQFKTKLNYLDIIININSDKKLNSEEKEEIYNCIFADKNILWHNDYTPYEFMNDIYVNKYDKLISDIKCISTWGEVNGKEVRIKMKFEVKYN